MALAQLGAGAQAVEDGEDEVDVVHHRGLAAGPVHLLGAGHHGHLFVGAGEDHLGALLHLAGVLAHEGARVLLAAEIEDAVLAQVHGQGAHDLGFDRRERETGAPF